MIFELLDLTSPESKSGITLLQTRIRGGRTDVLNVIAIGSMFQVPFCIAPHISSL